MRRYGNLPPGKFRLDDVLSAETVGELEANLCPRCNGNPLTCISCGDDVCTVGNKVREILKKETAQTQLKMFAEEDKTCSGASNGNMVDATTDPDWDLYLRAIHSTAPVKFMIHNHLALTRSHVKFTRRDARKFLLSMSEAYPCSGTRKLLEESLAAEEKTDYMILAKQIKEGTGKKLFKRLVQDNYKIQGQAADAYIDYLEATYGQEQPCEEEPEADGEGPWSQKNVNQIYEELLTKEEELQIIYEERREWVDQELAAITEKINAYEKIKMELKAIENDGKEEANEEAGRGLS